MHKRNPIRVYIKQRMPTLFRLISWTNQRVRWFLLWRRAGLPIADEMRAWHMLGQAGSFAPLPDQGRKAVRYVGTKAQEGQAQLAILMYYGCKPHHKVLEIGCGALNAGYPIMQYLNAGNYCGVEPNRWLVEDSLGFDEVGQIARKKGARFAYNEQFDGAEFGERFDFVISHSILSHAAHWQWPPFIKNVDACLGPEGQIFASLHFTEGNPYGDDGYPGTELDFNEWVYPGTSYFRKETVERLASQYGYRCITNDWVPAMLITSTHPAANHSWMILRRDRAAR